MGSYHGFIVVILDFSPYQEPSKSQAQAWLLLSIITTEQLGNTQRIIRQQPGNNYPRACARALTSTRGDRPVYEIRMIANNFRKSQRENDMTLLTLLTLCSVSSYKCEYWKISEMTKVSKVSKVSCKILREILETVETLEIVFCC